MNGTFHYDINLSLINIVEIFQKNRKVYFGDDIIQPVENIFRVHLNYNEEGKDCLYEMKIDIPYTSQMTWWS